MKIIFSSQSWEDYLYWQTADRRMLKRINVLIKEICRDHFRGTGKPEPLKSALAGYWSRRINDEHRLVYRIERDSLYIAQVRYHYYIQSHCEGFRRPRELPWPCLSLPLYFSSMISYICSVPV